MYWCCTRTSYSPQCSPRTMTSNSPVWCQSIKAQDVRVELLESPRRDRLSSTILPMLRRKVYSDFAAISSRIRYLRSGDAIMTTHDACVVTYEVRGLGSLLRPMLLVQLTEFLVYALEPCARRGDPIFSASKSSRSLLQPICSLAFVSLPQSQSNPVRSGSSCIEPFQTWA